MQSTLVRAACDHRTIRTRLRNWLSGGYRLLAVSSTPTFKGKAFTVEQVVKTLERGITMHLYHEKNRSSVTVFRNSDGTAVGNDSETLVFGYPLLAKDPVL